MLLCSLDLIAANTCLSMFTWAAFRSSVTLYFYCLRLGSVRVCVRVLENKKVSMVKMCMNKPLLSFRRSRPQTAWSSWSWHVGRSHRSGCRVRSPCLCRPWSRWRSRRFDWCGVAGNHWAWTDPWRARDPISIVSRRRHAFFKCNILSEVLIVYKFSQSKYMKFTKRFGSLRFKWKL